MATVEELEARLNKVAPPEPVKSPQDQIYSDIADRIDAAQGNPAALLALAQNLRNGGDVVKRFEQSPTPQPKSDAIDSPDEATKKADKKAKKPESE